MMLMFIRLCRFFDPSDWIGRQVISTTESAINELLLTIVHNLLQEILFLILIQNSIYSFI